VNKIRKDSMQRPCLVNGHKMATNGHKMATNRPQNGHIINGHKIPWTFLCSGPFSSSVPPAVGTKFGVFDFSERANAKQITVKISFFVGLVTQNCDLPCWCGISTTHHGSTYRLSSTGKGSIISIPVTPGFLSVCCSPRG
jgi:hypothetical protein